MESTASRPSVVVSLLTSRRKRRRCASALGCFSRSFGRSLRNWRLKLFTLLGRKALQPSNFEYNLVNKS